MIRLDDVITLVGGVCIDKGYGGLVRRGAGAPLEPVVSCTRAGGNARSRTRNGRWLVTGDNIPRTEYIPGVGTCLLIEPTVENLFHESEDLSVGAPPWSTNEVTITSTTLPGPFGPNSFDVIESANNDDHYFAYSGPALDLADAPHIVEVWARRRGRHWMYIRTVNQDGVTDFTWFDLSNGVVGTSQPTHSSAEISDEIVVAGIPWRRCSIVLDAGSGVTSPTIRFGITTADEGEFYDGDGTSGIAFANPSLYESGVRRSPVTTPTGATATKAPDQLTVPNQNRAPFQLYCNMIERIVTFADGQRVWHLGASGNPKIMIQRRTNGAYRLQYFDGVTTTEADLSLGTSPGDQVELLATFDGAVQLDGRVNGGAIATASDTALDVQPLSGLVLHLGGFEGTAMGAAAFRAMVVTDGLGAAFDDYPRLLAQLQDLAA